MHEYNIVQLMMNEGIRKAIKIYGIEKTEEKIKSVYRLMPDLKNSMLEEYYNMTYRKNLWTKIIKQ